MLATLKSWLGIGPKASAREIGPFTLSQPNALQGILGATNTVAGIPVNENLAFNYSVCWACTRVLSGNSAMLPLNAYEPLEGGGARILHDLPANRIVHDAVSPTQTAFMFRSTMMNRIINAGNSINRILWDGRGQIRGLEAIHPSRTKRPFLDKGRLKYPISRADGTQENIDQDEILHIPNIISEDGIWGRGVVTHARLTIGFGMATEVHGAALFGNGAKPTVVIKHKGLWKKRARDDFRKEWQEIHGGPFNAGLPAVLEDDAQFQELGMTNDEVQFLGTRQHNVEEMCRWYYVQPHLAMHLLRSTNNNIEHQSIEHVVYTLMPLLKLIEQAMSLKLLTEDQRRRGIYFKHNVDALLRGDAEKRTNALTKQFMNGALTIDEWRDIEDRNPAPDGLGKKHFRPQNLAPLDAPPAPPAKPGSNQPPPVKPKAPSGSRKEARKICQSTLERFGRKASEAARREIKKQKPSSDREAWARDFFSKQSEQMNEALRPIVRLLLDLDGKSIALADMLAIGLATQWCLDDRKAFLEVVQDAVVQEDDPLFENWLSAIPCERTTTIFGDSDET